MQWYGCPLGLGLVAEVEILRSTIALEKLVVPLLDHNFSS